MKFFLIVIDRKDSEKFRKFRLGEFSTIIKKSLKTNKSNFVWGLHKGVIQKNIWDNIRDHDIVFFTLVKSNVEVFGIVSKKLINKNLAKSFWPEDIESTELHYFLFLKELKIISIPYSEILRYAGLDIKIPVRGLFQIKQNYSDYLSTIVNNIQIRTKEKKFKPKSFELSVILKGAPTKGKVEVNRFFRDTTKVRNLKKLYKNRCQICSYTFEYEKGKFYSEVHHLNPLEEGGSDDVDNMIVLCPNHHAEFDYKIITIDVDGTNIIDRTGNKIGQIKFHKNHKLNQKNIESQLNITIQ